MCAFATLYTHVNIYLHSFTYICMYIYTFSINYIYTKIFPHIYIYTPGFLRIFACVYLHITFICVHFSFTHTYVYQYIC